MNVDSTPLVSIIMPAYNRASLIHETLDSVLSQTYTNWECIIIDDGSRDNTKSIVQNFVNIDPRFKLHDRPISYKVGANGARNFGISLSKGDFLMFLDSDDLLSDKCVETRINYMLNTNVSFIIYKTASFISHKKESFKIFNRYYEKQVDYLKNFLTLNSPWHISSALYRIRSFTNFPLFDENLLRYQDIDFHINAIISSKHDFLICPESDPNAFYRLSEQSVIDRISYPVLIDSFTYFIDKYYVINDITFWNNLDIEQNRIKLFKNSFLQIFIINKKSVIFSDLKHFIKIFRSYNISLNKIDLNKLVLIFYILYLTAFISKQVVKIPRLSKIISYLLYTIKS
jgi:glycosyltransferase involved in cell wall biosynthesis